MSNRNGMKKQKLLARKQELLNEIMYYEKRIAEARASQNSSNFYEDDSSESEVEFVINKVPSAAELTLQQERLRTSLRATAELTGVTVLQSEVNVLIDAPTFEGEEPITEEGLWREVLAECRVDLLSFSITFYTHQPSRQFAPPSYRGLRVTPAKPVHEKELSRSILPALTTPSDAVEALRSYAQEHRARRTTLASLVEKYADSLFMEPLPEGGYLLKCADLMRVSWTLQNQRSPLAPFHHNLSFHLEYMDEPYVRRIKQAHKQLGELALSAHRRTELLAEIIDTCLEARTNGQTDHPAEPSEVMGPPKSLPKKTKPKGKENTAASERKRSKDTAESGEGTSKRVKTDAKNASKDKTDVRSDNVYEKFSEQTKNNHTKNSSSEEGTENVYFSINRSDNLGKGGKKNKNLPKLGGTQYKNSEALKSTDVVKSKNVQNISKSANDKSSEKSAKNDQNKKVSENELKTKDKIIPAEKEPSNLKDKNNKGSLETRPVTQNNNPNSKAVATKNVKSKAVIDENEPKTKKSKMSETEKSATQNINSTETAEQKSKQKVVKNKEGTEKNPLKTDVNAAKQNKKNDAAAEKQSYFDNNDKQNEKEINQNLKTNTIINNKIIHSKQSLTKSKTNNNPEKDVVQKPVIIQTLAERFSKNKIKTHNIEVRLSNKPINKQITNNLLENNTKFSKNEPKISSNSKNKIADPKTTHESNQKSDKNVLKSKSNAINNEMNKNKNFEKQNNFDKNAQKTLNNKLNVNNQKLRKSLGVVKKSTTTGTMQSKRNSIIPQKRLLISKLVRKAPLRISPRKHHPESSTTRDSSKNSTNRQTHIPRLLKKPTIKRN